MEVDEYQVAASETMQFTQSDPQALSVTLLGLSGEVGELSTEYKKKIRDGESYQVFREKIIEELGDIAWYLAAIATIEGIPLSEILKKNAIKVQERWEDIQEQRQLSLEGEFLDDAYTEDEQLPREFVVEFREDVGEDGKRYAFTLVNGKPFGNPIRDNHYADDYYRFHDVFHFAYVTCLGWSPIVRKLLNRKRKTVDLIDEVEDGGRAGVIDEAISALVFEYARNHNFLDGVGGVDYKLLSTLQMLTRHLEVKACTAKLWEKAILLGFDIWRMLRDHKGGRVICSMPDQTMMFEEL